MTELVQPLLEDPGEVNLTTEDLKEKTAVQLKKILSKPSLITTLDEGLIPSKRVRYRNYPPGLTSISDSLPADLGNATGKCHPFSDMKPKPDDGPDLSDSIEVDVRFISIQDAARIGKNGRLHWILSLSLRREFFDIEAVRSVTEAKWNAFYWRTRFRLMRFANRVVLFESCMMKFSTEGIMESLFKHWFYNLLSFLAVVSLLWSLFVDMVYVIRFISEADFVSEEAKGGVFSQTILGNLYFCQNSCKRLKANGRFWAVLGTVIEVYASIVVACWLMCVVAIHHVLNLYMPLLSALVLYLISVYWNGGPNEKSEISYWIMTLFLVVGRLQLIRAFYFDLPKPGPLLMLTADFFCELFSFGMLMMYIFSSYATGMQLLYSTTVDGATSDRAADNCPGHPDLNGYCPSSSSYATLFFAMLGELNVEAFDALPGNMRTLAYILLISFLIIQSIFMLNILISILGDGFDRTKANEKATLAYHRALYMRQMEREMLPWERKMMDDKLRGYVYLMECEDGADQYSEWSGRVGTMKQYIHTSIGSLSNDIEEKLTSLKAEQRNQVDKLNGKLLRLEAQQKYLNAQHKEQMERLHSSIKELEMMMKAIMQDTGQ